MQPMILIAGVAGKVDNYVRAVEAAGGSARVSRKVDDLDACHALLLPGGGDIEPWRYGQENTASRGLDPQRDEAEFALLERALTLGKPVLGICRGLQIINVYFGGTLIQDMPGHHPFDGIDRLHTAHAKPSFFYHACGDRCMVNSAHHQAIDQLGKGLRAVQWAPDGTIEAVCHEKCPVWAVQWHPERLYSKESKQLFCDFLACCEA